MTAEELIAFEKEIADAFEAKAISGPIHLSGGNESELLRIFRDISPDDWIFSTYRSHYHALLHGINPRWLRQRIVGGHSMNIMNRPHHFFTSAIVGGTLSIAVGTAAALKLQGSERKVWCFIGDMASTTGQFHEAHQYACGHDLPITFVIENNGLSTNTPTAATWGGPCTQAGRKIINYSYERTYPHTGIGKWVSF